MGRVRGELVAEHGGSRRGGRRGSERGTRQQTTITSLPVFMRVFSVQGFSYAAPSAAQPVLRGGRDILLGLQGGAEGAKAGTRCFVSAC